MSTRAFHPDPTRERCPGCGHPVSLLVVEQPVGAVRERVVVTGTCPNINRKSSRHGERCRQPTALILDRYGHRYLFAPTFEALSALIESEREEAGLELHHQRRLGPARCTPSPFPSRR